MGHRKLGVDAPRAVDASGVAMDLADQLGQFGVGECAS